MIDIRVDDCDFVVAGAGYDFVFNGGEMRGVMTNKAASDDVVRLDFRLRVDGEVVDDFKVEGVEADGNEVVVLCSGYCGGGRLRFMFCDGKFCEGGNGGGVVYCYELDNACGASRIGGGVMGGEWAEVHDFAPDLQRFAVPERIDLPLRFGSGRKMGSDFFRFDCGQFMMPAYVLGIWDRKRFVGIGLFDVPNTMLGIDGWVSVDEFGLQFDYGERKRDGVYVSPRVGVWFTESRVGVLKGYRELLGEMRGDVNVARKYSKVKKRQGGENGGYEGGIYTSWGDQVYAKYIEEGNVTSEAGAEKYCGSELIDDALARLGRKEIRPETIVIDEGWADALGDWNGADEKFGGSLKVYIETKQAAGYRIILYFSPFLVDVDSEVVKKKNNWFVKDGDGEVAKVVRSGREYYLFDWSVGEAREYVGGKLRAMVSEDGLNADGVKVAGVKYLLEEGWRLSNNSYGFGESYLFAVIRDIHSFVKKADKNAAIFLACLNPLYDGLFDVVRLGNTSEVNHDLHVLRGWTASWLLPSKVIDTDDWAAYQKVVGTTTFIKVVAGVPNVFSSECRGDGRLRVQGAPGGHPVTISDEQYGVMRAAWKMYELSAGVDRGELHIDYDRMEFWTSDVDGIGTDYVRTHQGGNTLAVYTDGKMWVATLIDGKIAVDLPRGFEVGVIERVGVDGAREAVEFMEFDGGNGIKILFKAASSRGDTWYYEIKGKK